MLIKPSASIRQNYNEIANLCRETGEPVYLTKNGEEDRRTGRIGTTPDELKHHLDAIIDEEGHGK